MSNSIPTAEDVKYYITYSLLKHCYRTHAGTYDIPLHSIDLLCYSFEDLALEEFIVQEAHDVIEHMNVVEEALKKKTEEYLHWELAHELITKCVRQLDGMKYINFNLLEKKLKACELTLCQRKQIMQVATHTQIKLNNLHNNNK